MMQEGDPTQLTQGSVLIDMNSHTADSSGAKPVTRGSDLAGDKRHKITQLINSYNCVPSRMEL